MKKDILHEKHEFNNMRELIEWASEKYSERIAYSYKERPKEDKAISVSFRQFRDDVRALTTSLIKMGCTGKHCVLIGKLSYEWVLVYFATLSIGAVIVPLDRDWQGDELASTCEFADVDFLFCDGDISDKAEVISSKIKLVSPCISLGEIDEASLVSLIESGKKNYILAPEKYHTAVINPVKTSLWYLHPEQREKERVLC